VATPDAWSNGPWPAGPVEPILRPYGDAPPPLPSNIPREFGILAEFGAAIAKVLRDDRSAAFAQAMTSPQYLVDFILGFQRGSAIGGLRGCALWIGDLQHDIEVYSGESIALGSVLFDEVLRGLTEDNPQGLSRDSQRVVEASELLAPLKMLAALTMTDKMESIIRQVGLIIDDLVKICIDAGMEWFNQFLQANGVANVQGRMLGELVGVAYVMVVRFFVESAIQDAALPVP